MNYPIRGYAEGYYGRLFSWQERLCVLDTLHRLGMNTYYYAPKEDPNHRLHWRTDYSDAWYADFHSFCLAAGERAITVVAGVAPGLDFDFNDLPDGKDFRLLVHKCHRLLKQGAHAISLLMDDIDADFDKRSAGFTSEGLAHATLANHLAESLSQDQKLSLWVTPRIYADELIEDASDYLGTFMATLHEQHRVLYCGSDVVAHTLDVSSTQALDAACRTGGKGARRHRVILWDNRYANDYCPRRLFVGPWRDRHAIGDVLLNPTGMVHTDCLLLELMSLGLQNGVSNSEAMKDVSAQSSSWRAVLQSHEVPEEFFAISAFFDAPVFNTTVDHSSCEISEPIKNAIEHCLWRWKTPLAREWYPAIFGLKHDLLTCEGLHAPLRIRKTQTSALAQVLLQNIDP